MILRGTMFPDDPNTPLYCSIGANFNGKYVTATVAAIVFNTSFVECPMRIN